MKLQAVGIFCDDIRQEASGKQILVGVYGPELIPSQIPATINLALWVRIIGLKAGSHECKITLKGPGDYEAVLNVTVHPKRDGEELTVNLLSLPVGLSAPGILSASAQISGRKIDVGSLKISPARKPLDPFRPWTVDRTT